MPPSSAHPFPGPLAGEIFWASRSFLAVVFLTSAPAHCNDLVANGAGTASVAGKVGGAGRAWHLGRAPSGHDWFATRPVGTKTGNESIDPRSREL